MEQRLAGASGIPILSRLDHFPGCLFDSRASIGVVFRTLNPSLSIRRVAPALDTPPQLKPYFARAVFEPFGGDVVLVGVAADGAHTIPFAVGPLLLLGSCLLIVCGVRRLLLPSLWSGAVAR
ncbi:hypothetical protein ABT235_05365 [Micromonospora echinofusca]|uniref:hypothetical protein n=1 Tax=Micromonospora echinofusca TaxID=47858 RepID=UPI0033232C01